MKKCIPILLLLLPVLGISQEISEQQLHLDSLEEALKMVTTDSGKCVAHYNLGKYQFFTTRDLANASSNLFKALEMAERNHYDELKALCNDAFSWMEDRKGNSYKALQYAKKSCDYYRTSDKLTYIFKADYNLGCMFLSANKLDSSQIYLERSLKKAREVDNKNWILNSLMAIGTLYKSQGNYEKALEATLESAKVVHEKRGDYGNGRIPSNLAVLYAEKGNYKESDYWMDHALRIVKEKNDKLLFKEIYLTNFELKKKQGKIKEALENYELYVLYKDSIFSEDAMAASSDAENKYLNDLQKLEEEKAATEKKLIESEQKRTTNQKRWMIAVIFLILIILAIVVQRFFIIKKQKEIIHQQKEQVDEKNKEITDSITYAKRIQAAILPPDKLFKEHLPDSFVLYLPKDIVAGDFYWLEILPNPSQGGANKTTPSSDSPKGGEQSPLPSGGVGGGIILFAAADCTGHGVPGAMVSVVCHNALNRAVREYGLSEPGDILTKTRELVTKEFEKSDEEVKDGMDIALCKLEIPKDKSQKTKLYYAGANNPLWIARKGNIIEVKPDKQPIGKVDEPLPYTNHSIELEKDDIIYIFSDGYVDQFGGEKGKKLKSKAFKDLLVSLTNIAITEQKEQLHSAFKEWKRGFDQVDDICVIGVKV